MLVIAILSFFSCQKGPDSIAVTGVSLDKTNAELTEEESLTLVATVNPSNATNKKVSWESSDKAVATVDASGRVTAVKTGSASITVRTEDGGKTASCSLSIKAKVNEGGNEDVGYEDWPQ